MNRLIGTLLLVAGMAFGDAGDPPSRVARLNYLSGAVSFQPAGIEDWTPATLNYPMTTGDHLWADTDSRAEMHIGSTSIHVDSSTASSFLNLDDRTVQIRLSQGSLHIRIRNLADDEVYEVDTPNGAISLLRPGSYRIDADPDRQMTTVTVHGGQAEVTAGGSAFQVYAAKALASWCLRSDLEVDVNLGAANAYGAKTFAVAGADIQYAVISNLQLLAEVFRDQPGTGKYQVGARYIIVPNCVEAYASYANRLNKSSERSVVIGIRVQTAAILP